MDAVVIYTRANRKEDAFMQLDLLANKFKLRGSHYFVDDERLKSLKTDFRRDELMLIFENN